MDVATLPKPQVILTHESDLDGLVAGVLLQRLARSIHGEDIRLEAWHNHSWRQRPLAEAAAWVTDFGFEPRLDKAGWLVVDHHTVQGSPAKAQLIHDPARSAGSLCYELCRARGLGSPELDRLVHLNNIGDLFLTTDPDFGLANDYAGLVKNYGFWTVHGLVDGQIERLLDHPLLEVMTVKRRVEDPIGFEWSRRHLTHITPEVGLVQVSIGNMNLVLNHLLETQATPYTVLATLLRRPGGGFMMSLRSRNGQSLPVALALQGGGHPNAAGAALPKSVQSVADAVRYVAKALVPPAPIATKAATNPMDELLADWKPPGR